MGKYYLHLKSRSLLILSAGLLFAFQTLAQSFQIVWGMDQTLSGISSHGNFTPANAALYGAHPHGLPSVLFYSLGGGDYAYGTTYWHTTGAEKYLEFSFTVNTYEYDISYVSFRLRRSLSGVKDITLRSSLDGFSSDITRFHLTADGIFYQVAVPFEHANLSNGITFRIYGKNAESYLGVIYFDQIVIGGTVNNFILPVSLTYFTATLQEKQVQLAWETGWEKSSKEFQIERSSDMVEFSGIGIVTASGNSEGRQEYEFMDKQPLYGASYYRLKMIDQDGNYNYSQVRDVYIHDPSLALIVAPNPVSPDMIRIQRHFLGSGEVNLRDLTGRSIPVELVYSEINYLNVRPHYPLSSGIYVLTLMQNGRKQHAKVLVP